MRVEKPKFTVEVKIKYDVLENWRGLKAYMERNNWKMVGGCANGLRSFDVYSKEFTDTATMQKELDDIHDSFDYYYQWEEFYDN